MRWESDVYDPPLTTSEAVAAVLRILEKADFTPDSDAGEAVRKMGRCATEILEVWDRPTQPGMFFADPALRAAKLFSNGYLDLVQVWMASIRDGIEPARREQLM